MARPRRAPAAPVRRQLALPVTTSPLRGAILTVADALFDQDVPVPALTNRGFAEKFGGPSHGLDDAALAKLLGEYLGRGFLRWRGRAEHLLGRPDVIGLTPAGGAAWEAALHVLTGRPRWKKIPGAAVLPWRKMSVWIGRVSCRIPALAPDPTRFAKQFTGWRSARDLRTP